MPTIIDELIVKLGLDPKDFEQGNKRAAEAMVKTKRAAKEGSKEVSEGAGDMLKAFNSLQGRLLGVAALFTGGLGLTEFSKKMAAVTTQTTYLAKQVGVSAQALETWEGAGAKVGATAGEIAGSIANMNRQLLSGQLHGVSGVQKFFRAMNVNPYDRNGKARDTTDVYLDMSRWAKTQRPEVASQLFTEMGQSPGMINLLLQGPERLKAELDKNKKAALSDDDRKNFEELNTAFHELALSAERLGRAIAMQGGLLKFLNDLTRILDTFREKGAGEGAKALDDAAGSGVGDAFGSVKRGGRWLWNKGKNLLGLGSGDDSTASAEKTSAPASSAPSAPVTSGGGGGAQWAAEQRAPFAKELQDPDTRRLLGAVISSENPGAGPAVAESLMNRTMLVNKDRASRGLPPLTLRDMILGHPSIGGGKSFYGPVRNGAINSHLGRMQSDPAYAARMNRYIDSALAGSNVVEGYTDQGSRGDPNYYAGGTGVNINGERFNNWGYPGSAAFRQRFQENYARSAKPDVWTAGADAVIPHPGLMAFQGAGNVSHNNTTSTTSVQNLNVYSPTNDPYGHAADIAASLQRTSAMNQANQGPN